MIYSLALRMSGNPETAEDILQETFMQAFSKWEQFRGESRPSTWLYTIAVRKYLRSQRKTSGQPQRMVSLEELLPMGATQSVPDVKGALHSPLDEALKREALEELESAIVQLPSEYRIPLVLKEIAGFPVAEVSRIMGLKEATTKTRLHRARAMLFRTVSASLPQKNVPPAAYSKRVCMDLLRAKQESLDKGVDFPLPPGDFCLRCKAVFETMDFAHDLCQELSSEDLPAEARQAVLLDLASTI